VVLISLNNYPNEEVPKISEDFAQQQEEDEVEVHKGALL
jgi:hypothetical protein